MALVTLTHPARALSRDLLAARGGFAWWYFDLLDESHSGVVAIWSFGLPFLPGYLSGARRGVPERPQDRPSLNLVVYENGTPTFYLLQEYAADDAEWRDDLVRLGESTFRSAEVAGRRVLEAYIDCPVPSSRSRLCGTLRLDAVARRDDGAPLDVSLRAHDWSPLTGPARGEVSLDLDGVPFVRLAGRAYHDRNGSSVPFDRLGIEHWIWGRFPFEDRERIVYLLFPETRSEAPLLLGLDVERDGTTTRASALEVELVGRRRATFGMPHWDRVHLFERGRPWLELETERLLDDGPFYLRFGTRATAADGERAIGTTELVRPRRVDLATQRPFVRMKVHRVDGPNSLFLPLFTGPREGRVARQLEGMVTRFDRRGTLASGTRLLRRTLPALFSASGPEDR